MRTAFLHNFYSLLRPLMRVALRNGLTVNDLNQTLKQVMVDVCAEDYGIRGRPTSKSRIATMTGLSRGEVARLIEGTETTIEAESDHPIARLIGYWMREPEWHDEHGQPAKLSIHLPDEGFQKLAKKASSAVPHQTLQREIIRLGLANISGNKIRLLERGFIPSSGEKELFTFLGEDAAALIDTIGYNLEEASKSSKKRRYQRKAAFMDLTDEGFAELDDIVRNQGQKLLEFTDQKLATYRSKESASRSRFRGMGLYIFDLDLSRNQDNE